MALAFDEEKTKLLILTGTGEGSKTIKTYNIFLIIQEKCIVMKRYKTLHSWLLYGK